MFFLFVVKVCMTPCFNQDVSKFLICMAPDRVFNKLHLFLKDLFYFIKEAAQ